MSVLVWGGIGHATAQWQRRHVVLFRSGLNLLASADSQEVLAAHPLRHDRYVNISGFACGICVATGAKLLVELRLWYPAGKLQPPRLSTSAASSIVSRSVPGTLTSQRWQRTTAPLSCASAVRKR